MNNKNLLLFSLILLLPTQVENILQIYQNNGNIGLYGVFLGIYYQRNYLWIIFGLFLLSIFFNTTLSVKLILTIFSGLYFLKYIIYIKKYEFIFDNCVNQI